MNISTLPPSRELPDTAEGWLARLVSPECDAADFDAFEDWVAKSPAHAVAYAEAERLHALARASQVERLPARAKASAGRTAPAPLDLSQVRIAPRRHAPRARPVARWAWAAALALALFSAGWLWLALRPSPPIHYATAVGEQRRLTLADGSVLILDTDTALRVAYRRSRRQIDLLRGRIQAEVSPDPSRPFVVASSGGDVRAIGTVFQVENHDGETVVVRLLEGRVVVATQKSGRALELRPWQQIDYRADGRFGSARSIERAATEGWTRGRLVFNEKPLAELVAEVNRYSRDRLVLARPELGEIRISGAFASGDRAALLAALRQGWGLQAQRTGHDQTTLDRPR